MKKSNKKWGFLAPTREKAKEMEAKYGVHFTPLIDYMKVIFPDIDDWEEEKYFLYRGYDHGISEQDITEFYDEEDLNIDTRNVSEELYVKVDLYSASGHKSVVNSDIARLYKYNKDTHEFSFRRIIMRNNALECTGSECYYINSDVQLTNATVKHIFGVEVKEPLFDENTPTITQPWTICPRFRDRRHITDMMKSALKRIYVDDEKQYQVNFDALSAYYALYVDNIGLSKIIVNELFDLYNYEIDLNTEKKISILIGPNGCGKTTILKIVRFILSGGGNIEEIKKIPFKSITGVLVNGRKIELNNYNGKLCAFIDNQEIANFDSASPFMAVDKENSFKKCFRRALNKYSCYLSTKFISAQRLLSKMNREKIEEENIHQYFDTISKIKDDFKHFCEFTGGLYNELKSNAEHSLFSSYIIGKDEILENDVFEEKWKEFSGKRFKYEFCKAFYQFSDTSFIEDMLRNKYYDMVETIRRYKSNSKDKKQFLCLYLRMFDKALAPIEELYKKTKLFQRIINDRFKITKKQLQYRFGEMYLTIGEGKNKKEIPLEVLSSGEKNDFIMFYNLIFNCENSKVLIDEPEISQHIEWQERFIDDLSEICEINNIQALVATHSPNIINDHTDLIAKWDVKDGR